MDDYHDPTRIEFQGLPVYLSATALGVSISKAMSLYDILAILEEGEENPNSERELGVIERCATHRKEKMKVVAVHTFHQKMEEECWLIVHLG